MTLKTLDIALDVLLKFTKENSDWGLRELSREMEINHTILHRILRTYENKGFLSQNSTTKKYELGNKLFDLLSVIKNKVYLSDLVFPIMEEISRNTNESVFLTWKDGFDGVTVDIAESTQSIKFAVAKGTRTPLYAGASCKIIMAYLDYSEKVKVIENGTKKFANNTLTEKNDILNDLDEIKMKSWCYSEGEYSEDVFGLGVPIFNKFGEVLASLTIAGPIYRINDKRIQEHLKVLLDHKGKLENYIQLLDVISYK